MADERNQDTLDLDPVRPASSSSQSSIRNSHHSQTKSPPASHPSPHVLRALQAEGLAVKNGGVVTFAVSSPAHPRQWPLQRKIYDTAVICLLEFLTTVISNSGSDVSREAGPEIGLSREMAIFCLTTLYLLGQAFGGLLLTPVCEAFGGKLIYVGSSAGFTAMCLMIGLVPSIGTVVVGRFVSGALSAMPTVVACGSIENMWDTQDRIWAVDIWAIAGFLGMAIGPVYAVYVSESNMGWHWVFHGASIAVGLTTALAFFMQESRPKQLLRKKVKVVSRKAETKDLEGQAETSAPGPKEFFQASLSLPLRLFFTEPIVCLSSIMGATVGSIFYLFAEALPVVYTESYNFSTRHGSLVFLVLAAGTLLSLLPRFYDIHIAKLRASQQENPEPEDKLFGFLLAAPLLAISLWWFAGSVPPYVSISPAVSMIPLLPIGFVVVEFDYVLSGYLADIYATHAASATVAMCFLRAVLSGVFPLFGRQMFEGLGANNATFILAGLATMFCGVAEVFRRHGKTIRHRSRVAEETGEDPTVMHG